jgi:integrase
MGRITVSGVQQKGPYTYLRRYERQPDGSYRDRYYRLPDPSDPGFSDALARLNGEPVRETAGVGSMAALIALYRPVLANMKLAEATRLNWHYYLGLIEQQHGTKPVALLARPHVIAMRDAMAGTPGKANNYIAKLRGLLEFAIDRGWIATNPARGVPNLKTGEHEPWPADVLAKAIDAASPMLRLAIITGLCSGQRLSDVIRMQHGAVIDGIRHVRSIKTKSDAFIPMHPLWLAEIAKIERKSVTLLYDRFGKPFSGTDRIQEQIRRLMRSLGYVDEQGKVLYTFHGLGKNACCYLIETGISEDEISAILGKTVETVRYYGRRARTLMVAKGAAERAVSGAIMDIRAGEK